MLWVRAAIGIRLDGTGNVLQIVNMLTVKHNNFFGLTKWRHFSRKCTDTDWNITILQVSDSRITKIPLLDCDVLF